MIIRNSHSLLNIFLTFIIIVTQLLMVPLSCLLQIAEVFVRVFFSCTLSETTLESF